MSTPTLSPASYQSPASPRPFRVWPGVLAVALQWLCWLLVPWLFPDVGMYAFLGAIAGGLLAVLVWWLFFSRAPWAERIGAIVLMVGLMIVTRFVVHPSVAGGGMGFLLYFYAIPVLCLALVLWAAVFRRVSRGPRRAALLATVVVACGIFTVVRTGGISGGGDLDLHWRWTPTPEERLLARASNEQPAPPVVPVTVEAAASWPGFRGPNRDSVVHGGVRIGTDWAKTPPVELWRRQVGPGWSSFAVEGDRFYTQEQRGEEELVSCYQLATGRLLWSHRDQARFWESNAGPGPRATPTLAEGRVYTLGATGIVNALDAADGRVVWTRNASADTGVKVPDWAFAGSPLVVDDLVIVATGGRLVAYDRGKGEQRWVGPEGVGGYSSPQLVTLGGVKQVLLHKAVGVVAVEPATGKELWKHTWKGDGIVQAGVTADGDVLLGSGSGVSANSGMCRLGVAPGSNGWTVQERWVARGLRPYFSDYVLHRGHAFGFDSGILACLDLKDGQRKWKGGRYGHGQVLLLAEQDLLLVLSETGVLILVAATPDRHQELARHQAIEGKTWNHPVLVGDLVLVRNGEEMAAFRLPRTQR